MPKTEETDRQQSVLDLLNGLNGVEPLKKLFWTELNYERVNRPLSRKGWTDGTAGTLIDDPILFAAGGDQFHIIHSRLNSDRLLMDMERAVVSRLLRDHPYALFVFSNAKQDRWHFLNVKYDDDVKRRRLFRRITIGPEEKLRTASERLNKINLADARDHSPFTIQKLHDDAFDVEPVTKEFFKEYGRIFDEVEEAIRGLRDKDRKHLFVQRLFNRIMFIAFIQKKGWLKLDGNTDYLNTLWRAYKRDTGRDKNFYSDRLKPLFFAGLNSEVNGNRSATVKRLIGDVPYLNGGLFEEDEDDQDADIVVPDKALDAVLNDLFARFNFTVTESTPLDVEVAVDPEMLGKIFEEMVTGRHEIGSYYTPKVVVSFMSREALKGYLESQLPTESKDAIADFVDAHNPAKLRNAEAVLEALRRIEICDPACGSGAYLVGMLHELLDLRACLFVTKNLDAKSVYDRKLEVIQKNVYGVDLDPFAVNIARLRLWLSLSVDYEGDAPPPLPNLDYKVEAGDSIGSPNPSSFQLGLRKTLVDEFLAAKAEYISAHHGRKLELRKKIDRLRKDIATWAHRGNDFDWPIEFAEVFVNGGFDVVISNPPYVRIQELNQSAPKMAAWLKQQYKSAGKGNYDLYVVFVERGLQLLAPRGQFAYILPHKFFNADYGQPLRQLLSDGKSIRGVVHFGNSQVFSSATNYVCLLFLSKEKSSTVTWTKVDDFSAWLDNKESGKGLIAADRFEGKEWNFSVGPGADLLERLQGMPVKLGDLAEKIYQGLATSADSVYILSFVSQSNGTCKALSHELEREVTIEKDLVHPLLKGSEIGRYGEPKYKSVVLFPYSVDGGDATPLSLSHLKKGFPKAYEYLLLNKQRLIERSKCDESNWWLFPYPKNLSLYQQPKIVIQVLSSRGTAFLDQKGKFYFVGGGTAGGNAIKTRHNDLGQLRYLTGILNSSVATYFVRRVASGFRGGFFAFGKSSLEGLPVPVNSAGLPRNDEIENLVEWLAWLYRQPNVSEKQYVAMASLFQEIVNALVYELFFPQELGAAELRFLSLVKTTGLPTMDAGPSPKAIRELSDICQTLGASANPLGAALARLQNLDIFSHRRKQDVTLLMPTHDIIDNRSEKLVDHINRILGSTEAARFAVGYFFLSGLESIAKPLARIKELKLLIGNTTNRETLEQLAEGYRRLELVSEKVEEQVYPKRGNMKRMAEETAENIRSTVELMDQTDDAAELVRVLVRLIEEKRLKVKIYTKGRMHAKAYIFDYADMFNLLGNKVERHENGIAIVGSSNLTLSGVSHNTELNVVVSGNNNHFELGRWFDELWNEAQDFDEALMQEMRQSWAVAQVRPYDVYMKTLYALVRDRLEDEDDRDILWDDEITNRLADFQKVAVRQSIQIIRDYGGVFVSDVVGLGKSYIGAAIVKHFERTDHARPLVVCPAKLVEMWERYNEVYQLNARVLSMGFLQESDNGSGNVLLDDSKYKDRDFVLVDESHNFRYEDTQRYKLLQAYLSTGTRRSCFVTATPRNKSAWDVYNQIKLFHQDDKTDLPVDPADLKQYFKQIEEGRKKLPDLLSYILIRRTRNHILRWYGYDAKTHERIDPARYREYQDGFKRAYVMVAGKHQFFPKRELDTIEYSIEDTYQGLYQELKEYLGKPRKTIPDPPEQELTYARYGLWRYVSKDKQKHEPYASLARAGNNLRGLIRILLFKRFESSVYAFEQTVRRLLTIHERFVRALDEGFVPAGEDAQRILYESDFEEESDLISALRAVSNRYNVADFDLDRLRRHIEHDLAILQRILSLVKPITPERDTKLQTLIRRLEKKPLEGGKRLIFTQYADTARYLFDNLRPHVKPSELEVIFSGDKSTARVVGRFAPKANPEYRFQAGETELNTVVATDVLSEGLNLQDCDKIINYDLHWNPVRLIQRFGRIDRIGSDHDVVYGFNFLPETGIDRNLGLKQKLHNRIQEIHNTIGEDSAILDSTEQLNEEAMYAIYEKKGGNLGLFEDEEEEFVDLNEAEEILRLLRKENPAEYDRIANLRDGIRAGKPDSTQQGLYVFCQADRYQQLFLLDKAGDVISRDVPKVLGAIKCGPDLKGVALPADYNAAVMRVKRQFTEEVKHRETEREHTVSLTHGQRYALRELRVLFGRTEDDDVKAQINVLEKAFRAANLTSAVKKELNLVRRNNLVGESLLKTLVRLYQQHNIREWLDRQRDHEEPPIPRIICSEALQ